MQVNVRYTIPDYDKIYEDSVLCGMQLTDYIRNISLNKSTPKPTLSSVNQELLVELTRQGTNLNQLTKIANTGIKNDYELKKVFLDLNNTLNNVKLILINNGK